MRREAQNLLLLLAGGVILRITFDGSYLRYVKSGLYPFLLVGGLGFVFLAVVAIVRDIRRSGIADDHAHGRAQWLLLAPVAVLLLIAPPALGADAVATSSRVRVAASPSEDPEARPFPPLPSEPVPTLTIYDLVTRAVSESDHSLDGREVAISGFVPDPAADRAPHHDDSVVDLARMLITCCVADAEYISVHLSGIGEPIAPGTWLQVEGSVEPGSASHDTHHVPTLHVSRVRPIPAPDRGYEYPR